MSIARTFTGKERAEKVESVHTDRAVETLAEFFEHFYTSFLN